MPERAELREFHLSEYHQFRYVLHSLFCSLSVVVTFAFAVFSALGGSASTEVRLLPPFVFMACAGLLARLFWLRANRPYARLSSHGLTLQDGLLFPTTLAWARVYAIEPQGAFGAVLRLSGMKHRSIELTMFEREERKEFVEAVRKWVYSSH